MAGLLDILLSIYLELVNINVFNLMGIFLDHPFNASMTFSIESKACL